MLRAGVVSPFKPECYKPLRDNDVERIHRGALDLLEQIGLSEASASCIELVCGAGGRLTNEGRLVFPRGLVEDTIAGAGRNFQLHGQDPKNDLNPWGDNTYFSTAGAAVHIYDAASHEYRESTLKDLYNIARLVDSLDHIDAYSRPVVARDMEDSHALDINTLYTCITGTSKHGATSMSTPESVRACLDMLHIVAGGEDKWRARPFITQTNCFVVPPMKFATESLDCMEVAVRGGMPIMMVSAGQSGATSPAALAGTIMQEIAEVLAGLVFVNLISPGHPAISVPAAFVSDLRTGAMSGGSGEQALLSASSAQMSRYYDLCAGALAGITDSKTPDAQHGYEKGMTEVLAAHAGANMIYESAGMQASLLAFSMEGMVIDNDMIGNIKRTLKGIEVTEDSLSIENLDAIIVNPNADFSVLPDALDTATLHLKDILSSHYPDHTPVETDAMIREKFDIRLPKEIMRA
ncbi:MAG: methyltransferase [Rhodospirillales bacterium]|jgi:trimethylamine---corrinoid protein Co-methyltransferase|nr:methyltransferase [Rhodospirillales bacterium]